MGNTLAWEKGRQLKQYGANTYKYNNEGIRIKKTTSGEIHEYILDGTNIVKEIVTDICNCPKYTNEYLYDLDGTVCGIKHNGTAYYFYKNLQGDIIAITNDAGAVVARYTYDAWGKCTITSDNSGVGIATINPFRYRSYYYDTEIGLYYLQSRYYDASVGRFINGDEILLLKNNSINKISLFVYCNNDPIKNFDCCGYSSTSLLLGIISVILSFVLMATPLTWLKITLALIVGVAQIGVAIWDYNNAMRTLKWRYGTKSDTYKRIKQFNDIMLTIALISAGITVITSALGFFNLGQRIINSAPVLFLSVGIALSFSLFGVSYDFADILISNNIKFKSSK